MSAADLPGYERAQREWEAREPEFHGPRASDFHAGDRVLYVPNHANGDTAHPDCECGVVTSTNAVNVFVRYGKELHAKATSPENLVSRSA
jgi:hypothetical protein